MTGLVTLLFNPVTIFGVLFFAFGIKNLFQRRLPSAIVYLVMSLCITLGGVWFWSKVARSHGQMPAVVEEADEGSSNIILEGIPKAASGSRKPSG